MMQTGRPNPYWIAKVINQFGLIPTPPVNGDVFGPGSSVAGHVAIFGDATGKLIADGGLSISYYDTRTSAAAATIPTAVVNFVQTAGRASVGDYGAALYKKVGGSLGGGFQSADGQWWGLADTNVTPEMFGDCSGECHVFIQNAIDYLNSVVAGNVLFHAQTYTINATVTLYGAVSLIGVSQFGTFVPCAVDTTNLSCAGASQCTIQGMFFYNSSASPTHNVMEVDASTVGMTVRDTEILGGVAALNISGTDCLFENCTIAGNTWHIFSRGANWYLRCKLDNKGQPGSPTAIFAQSTPHAAGVQENNFTMCDFSNASAAKSVLIDDGATSTAFTTFSGCVFGQAITVTSAKGSMFSACEIGSATFTVGTNPTAITGCIASAATVVSGGGKTLAGNINIT